MISAKALILKNYFSELSGGDHGQRNAESLTLDQQNSTDTQPVYLVSIELWYHLIPSRTQK